MKKQTFSEYGFSIPSAMLSEISFKSIG